MLGLAMPMLLFVPACRKRLSVYVWFPVEATKT